DVGGSVCECLVGRDRLAREQRDREVGSSSSDELVRLVDRAALLTQQDVLQTSHRGILTRNGNGQTVLVQDRDDAGGVGVVGSPHSVDVTAELGESLLEDGGGVLAVPLARG